MSQHQGSMTSYSIGFVLSLLFTIAPYLLVTEKIISGTGLLFSLAVFAVAQVFVQLLFFLHLNQEKRPYWQRLTFGFMTIIVVIVVFGSLWIMNNLDYHMQHSEDIETYIQNEEAITPHETNN